MSRVLVGRYRMGAPLGGGGTSLVYRAETLAGGPEVAVKLLRPQFAADAALRRRFAREAELARGLDHPGIVRILDAGEDDRTPFLVMELADGETLRQTLDRDGPLPADSAWPIFVALAQALDHAHGRGVIHRDVKPQNVFVSPAGVKLGDFGNARVVSLASVTGASLSWGTPEYVAPETFVRGRADPRSDLYSLGVVLHEMLTGRVPWSRAQVLTRLGGRAAGAPNPPATGAGAGFDRLITDLVAFSPADRPASGEEAVARHAGTSALATLPAPVPCPGCGAPRAPDIPRCLSCGHEVVRLRHDPHERWVVALNRLEDDAATSENLLRTLEPLVQPVSRPLHFLTGSRSMYSKEELKAGIDLPAVLLSDLDEPTARALESLLRKNGLDARAGKGVAAIEVARALGTRASSWITGTFLFMWASASGWMFSQSRMVGLAVGAATVLATGAIGVGKSLWRSRRGPGLVRLRKHIEAGPAAEQLLSDAAGATSQVRAPELRALLGDVATEIYRLARRAEQLARPTLAPSSEAELLRRTSAAASALIARLHRSATRLDALDQALSGATEGELMQALARLDRAATAPGADREALAAAHRDLEASLDRRHATEQERARLAAALCMMLGRLRTVCRRALSLPALEEQEAHAVEAASAELDAFLAAPPV